VGVAHHRPDTQGRQAAAYHQGHEVPAGRWRVQECKSARVQECKSARVQECKSARVQECKSARAVERKMQAAPIFPEGWPQATSICLQRRARGDCELGVKTTNFQRRRAGRGDGSAGLPARPAALLLAAGLGVLPEEVHDKHQLVHLA
jgi:hypothetical protein